MKNATLIIATIGMIFFGCRKDIPPIGNDEFDSIIVPQDFNYETSGIVNLRISDVSPSARYEIYSLFDIEPPEVVYTETDTLLEIEHSNQLLDRGFSVNGSYAVNLSIPGHQNYLYVKRLSNGAFSGKTVKIDSDEIEINFSSIPMKATAAEDVIYFCNNNGEIGYFNLTDQEAIVMTTVEIGSSAMAFDKASQKLYYCQKDKPFSIIELDVNSLESRVIGNMGHRAIRMEYNEKDGMLYMLASYRLWVFDPHAEIFISKYKINNAGYFGDICFGLDDKLYAVTYKFYRVPYNGESNDIELIVEELPRTFSGAVTGSDGMIYAGSSQQIWQIDPTNGDAEYLFHCGHSITDMAIWRMDQEQSNQDNDGDGVPNDQDEYPEDANRVANSWYPGENSFGTLAFEDLWPSKGDYDFNDMVIDYKFKYIKNAQNKVVALGSTFKLRAIGGSVGNGFGFQMELSPEQISGVISDYNLLGSGLNLSTNGLENGQDKAVVIVFDDGFKILKHPGGGSGINTNVSNSYVEPVEINLEITFTQGFEMHEVGVAPANPFIFRSDERGREIHIPGYPPTSLVNESYFGTGNDATDLNSGYYYKTKEGHPWGMNVPVSFVYPLEKVSISEGYKTFTQWASSGGFTFMDWYLDQDGYRDETRLFTKD